MVALPKTHSWLQDERGPRILLEGLKTLGVKEVPGAGDNPTLVRWAEREGFRGFHDATAWCGLWAGYVSLQAGFGTPVNPLWARNWLKWGTPVDIPMLGDILVFPRGAGGHVAMYVGENDTHYFLLGGNQSDAVSIKTRLKKPILGARRCAWKINQPKEVRRVIINARGEVSTKES